MERKWNEIVISIRPMDVDYDLIFSDTKRFDEFKKILLNWYISYLTGWMFEVAESWKAFVTDLELAHDLWVEWNNKEENNIADIIPVVDENSVAN